MITATGAERSSLSSGPKHTTSIYHLGRSAAKWRDLRLTFTTNPGAPGLACETWAFHWLSHANNSTKLLHRSRALMQGSRLFIRQLDLDNLLEPTLTQLARYADIKPIDAVLTL
jgi:hypothetical protein